MGFGGCPEEHRTADVGRGDVGRDLVLPYGFRGPDALNNDVGPPGEGRVSVRMATKGVWAAQGTSCSRVQM